MDFAFVLKRVAHFLSSPVRSSLSHVKAALIPAAFTFIPARASYCNVPPVADFSGLWLYEKCATVFRCEWLRMCCAFLFQFMVQPRRKQ
jgi:hypothetical protein